MFVVSYSLVVHTGGCLIATMNTVVRRIKLVPRRKLWVAALVLAVLVFAFCNQFFLPAPLRFAVFGLDRHSSVMGLSESDVLVTRIDDDDAYEIDSVQTAETIGVFVVIGSATWRRRASHREPDSYLQCLSSYRYQIFVIAYPLPGSESSDTSSLTLEDRKQYDDDDDAKLIADQLRAVCIESGSLSVVAWMVRVSIGVSMAIVADLVTEAYVDNVTWYDVVFPPSLTSSFPEWDSWPPAELGPVPHIGAAVKTDAASGTRVAFHRTHVEIFGDVWPHWAATGADVAGYLKAVYADNPASTSYSSSSSSSSGHDSAVLNDCAWLRRQVH